MNYSFRFGDPRRLPDGTVQKIPRYAVNWSLNFRNLSNHENLVALIVLHDRWN